MPVKTVKIKNKNAGTHTLYTYKKVVLDGIRFLDINRENEIKSRQNEHAFQEFNIRRKYFFVLVIIRWLFWRLKYYSFTSSRVHDHDKWLLLRTRPERWSNFSLPQDSVRALYSWGFAPPFGSPNSLRNGVVLLLVVEREKRGGKNTTKAGDFLKKLWSLLWILEQGSTR